MEALPFRGEPGQLIHAARVVEHSVNRAGQKIVEPLDDSRPVAMPLAAGRSPSITGFVRTAPAPIVPIIAALGWG